MDPNAKFVWTDPHGSGRNRYSLFRRSFELPGEPAKSQFHIFADTRYRLSVNGETVGHGPARFMRVKPEYDTWDIGPLLRKGRNVLAVTVNSYGGLSFHSEKGVGCLIAWGAAEDKAKTKIDLATGPEWRAITSPGHNPDTAYLSFALNAGEMLDASAMPAGWDAPYFDDTAWPKAVKLESATGLGQLFPRSIPLLDEREVLPYRSLGAWSARPKSGEDVYSLMVTIKHGRSSRANGKAALFAYIHSSKDQKITFGAWWGRYWVNGKELAPAARFDGQLRQDFPAELAKGWNSFMVYETFRSDWWDFYLALPAGAGLTLSAEKDLKCPNTFLIGGPWEPEQAELADGMAKPLAAPGDLPSQLGPWRAWPRNKSAQTPCRQRAWKTFHRISDDAGLQPDIKTLASKAGDGTLCLLYDFGGEILGRPVVDFDAAAGTIVDLSYSERLKADGTSDVHNRFFVDMVERYVARSGRQIWQTFHPRGFRYLEVLITGNVEKFRLNRLSVSRANYPVANIGRFECSDPVLNRVWELGRVTQHACMEDAYVDCPWRERGLYSGDFLVQFFTNMAAFGDVKLFRRCIELFLLAQGANGLVPGGAFGIEAGLHPDYSAILVQAMYQYWRQSGEQAFLQENAGRLLKLLEGLEALKADGRPDLLDGSSMHPYIDLSHFDKDGVCCSLNCFCQKAFADGSAIFRLVGMSAEAERFSRRADHLAQAIRREFWDESAGAFVDRLRSDVPATGPSVPSNALAILYDIASPEQAVRAGQRLQKAMLENFRVANPARNDECNVTSYFAFYALGAMFKLGMDEQAQQFVRKYYGRMLDLGAWTMWEYFVDSGGSSLCHAWSTCPTHYLSTRTLGVVFPEAGRPEIVAIRPNPGGLTWAQGVYPHPAGPMHVSWRIRNGRLETDCQAPPGVKIVE
ncbi:MAG: family 78 glycoside hydrolase catalytic domain [Planctomycetes bacterium]|nr:family 78 glycoside hydrolase catalytic domain [Planctomycetota bacterium]